MVRAKMNTYNKDKIHLPDCITWKDYRDIAVELERNHAHEDVMMLRREKLIALIQDIPRFDSQGTKPDPYTLDDIRFEWFFLKKGTGEWPDSGHVAMRYKA